MALSLLRVLYLQLIQQILIILISYFKIKIVGESLRRIFLYLKKMLLSKQEPYQDNPVQHLNPEVGN